MNMFLLTLNFFENSCKTNNKIVIKQKNPFWKKIEIKKWKNIKQKKDLKKIDFFFFFGFQLQKGSTTYTRCWLKGSTMAHETK
jgi:hypothetical protein